MRDPNYFQHIVVDRGKHFHDEPPSVAWWALALVGEAGELANQAKKIWRDDRDMVSEERRRKMLDELGDVLAYAAAIADALDCNLSTVMANTLAKIDARIARGTAKGGGDER